MFPRKQGIGEGCLKLPLHCSPLICDVDELIQQITALLKDILIKLLLCWFSFRVMFIMGRSILNSKGERVEECVLCCTSATKNSMFKE